MIGLAARTSTSAGNEYARRFALAVCAAAMLVVSVLCVPRSAAAAPSSRGTAKPSYTETYRPQFHFSPAQNWMNDPNGLLYYRGEYHLFFQYNPSGTTWGNMSWGHAVSRDLVHWRQLPVAIRNDANEMIFSGSAVIDYRNTTGFGRPGNPAMVAVYTSARADGTQQQAIAYSLDGGRTFTKYGVVLPTPYPQDPNSTPSTNFRDPKVFWYAPGKEWLMTAVLSDQHKVAFYSSPDLKHWTSLSTFGPAGATGGVWECPDLFPLADPTHHGRQKWVLVVNLNPGGIAGGSGAQYFVGDFDGHTFTSDDKPYAPPTGTDLGSFDDGTFDGWTATGSAFGDAPATGTLPGQQTVSGWSGAGYVNGFHGGDATTGTLTSPGFTIDRPYLNFLVGGGDHPYVPGGSDSPPPGNVFADFEGPTYGDGWTTTGDFVGTGPTHESLPGQLGQGVLDTCVRTCDPAEGTITSAPFTIDSDYIDLLVAGGKHPMTDPNPTAVNLVVDGRVVASATGQNSGDMDWTAWDVRAWKGKTATIQVVDQRDSDWGHLMVDNIVFSDRAAAPWNNDTAVNLLVNGHVVRTTTGSNSEALDWASWNLRGLQGERAQLQLVDNNTGGWGHVLADQFSQSDAPALSALDRAHWVDFGSDDYAAVTYNDAPGGKRIMIGWMNNWNYGQSIPTSPWRSAMTVPRQLALRSVDGALQLVQRPVRQLAELESAPVLHLQHRRISAGTTPLPVHGEAVRIDATLKAGTASRYGLKVRTGNGQETDIGYDRDSHELYIDRSKSGNVTFDPTFTGRQSAPLTAAGGRVHVTILVDWSSVEVFGQHGQVLLTDQIFPDPSSTGLAAFAVGGTATVRSLTVRHMHSAWR